MGLAGFLDRRFLGPILMLNFVLYVIVLGIAGWALDNTIESLPIYGNEATNTFIQFSLIAGVVGVASIVSGLHLIKDWRDDNNVTANLCSALISWLLLLLAFGLACKEIHMGGEGTTLKFMETFVIILTATHGFYVAMLHSRSLVRLPV
ncbi:hypothetical protein KP509_30G074200 [Ceratopteris richardii]|uniref:Uncharacterized protein n=1 Tax=Ceratopteris richardii TaxID=49495 RepID=A0A8T2R3R6_CERRI|nr:hypothetical protein KP509_30G074200 [Ceratopteris richardii]KAH7291033.1 hypothetical protein KP509_30G074200 [Ceratopteris richardii]